MYLVEVNALLMLVSQEGLQFIRTEEQVRIEINKIAYQIENPSNHVAILLQSISSCKCLAIILNL